MDAAVPIFSPGDKVTKFHLRMGVPRIDVTEVMRVSKTKVTLLDCSAWHADGRGKWGAAGSSNPRDNYILPFREDHLEMKAALEAGRDGRRRRSEMESEAVRLMRTLPDDELKALLTRLAAGNFVGTELR